MAVEDELRGGAIPDIKPRILTDQVCACVYLFYHPYSLIQSCPKTLLLHSCITSIAFAAKPVQGKSLQLSYTPLIPIFQKYICHI